MVVVRPGLRLVLRTYVLQYLPSFSRTWMRTYRIYSTEHICSQVSETMYSRSLRNLYTPVCAAEGMGAEGGICMESICTVQYCVLVYTW